MCDPVNDEKSSELAAILRAVQDEEFYLPGAEPRRPAHNRVFAEVLRRRLGHPHHAATIPIHNIYGEGVPDLARLLAAVNTDLQRRVELAEAEAAVAAAQAIVPPQGLDELLRRANEGLAAPIAREFLRRVPAGEPPPLSELLRQVETYLARLPVALSRDRRLDLPLATAIGTAAVKLICATEESIPAHRSLVAAAVAYFIEPVDIESDVAAFQGLSNDASVLAWVIRELALDIEPPTSKARPSAQ